MNARIIITTLVALVLLQSAEVLVQAQDCNNSSCGKIVNGGTIRFTRKTAQFRNEGSTSNVNNDSGTIEFRGTNAAFSGANPLGAQAVSRIGGYVIWTATDSNQIVQPRYYTNLGVSGSNKFIGDSVFVSKSYLVALSTGRRNYSGLFCYDGTGVQSIVPEHGLNAYDKLELQHSLANQTKALLADTATVRGTFLNNANNIGGFDVRSKGVLNLRSLSRSNATLGVHGDSSAILVTDNNAQLIIGDSSTMSADNGGRVDVNSTFKPAAFIINFGSTFSIGTVATGGQYHLFANSAMNVEGLYTNSFTALTNAYYECSSTVRYIATVNGQNLQASANAQPNRYGILETIGGSKLANGNVNIKCGLWVNPGTHPHTITMPRNTAMAIYNDNPELTPVRYDSAMTDCESQSEVIGTMVQIIPANINSRELTYNNRMTTLRFTDFTRVPASLSVTSLPATNPNQFVASSDVHRKLNVTYTAPQAGTPVWTATVRAGFREDECVPLRAAGLLGAVRTFDDPSITAPRKIGDHYNRNIDSACVLHWVSVDNISFAGPNALGSGNDLLLRAAPSTLYSVRPGRWSNPATWSDNTEPYPFDSVVVYHNVWAGFTRPASNGWDGYSVPERFPNAMAAAVVIQGGPDSVAQHAALVFGQDSTAPVNNGLFRFGNIPSLASTRLGTDCLLQINDCGASGSLASTSQADFLQYALFRTSLQPGLRGLVIYGSNRNTQTLVHVNDFQNAGWLQNSGIFEVGD